MTRGYNGPPIGPMAFFRALDLRWLDGRRPLVEFIEPYRAALFDAFATVEGGQLRYTQALCGRAKKNWKTTDGMLIGLFALLVPLPLARCGHEVYVVANDEGQASDDLTLLKKLIRVNPKLDAWLKVKKNTIERRDGEGFLEILPARDAIGAHGKTFRLLVVDELHGHRTWDLLEALAPDPTRPDAQTWLTSYASIFHKPLVPLYDIFQRGRAGDDPGLLFSWYAADFTTDPAFAEATPEARANPSMVHFQPGYLARQRRRLPSHKYRRLHLNLPGLPEGSAYQPEPIADAIARGVKERPPESGRQYSAFVDMSGGSRDDAVLAIVHEEGGRIVLDRVQDQGPPPPFDPNAAVPRFVRTLEEYGVARVTGDRYAGLTFQSQFETAGITYTVADKSKHEIYEAFEPMVNGGRVELLDDALLEQQLLGLIWRGGRIDHPAGEHDDRPNAACGAVVYANQPAMAIQTSVLRMGRTAAGDGRTLDQSRSRAAVTSGSAGSYLERYRDQSF